MYEVYILKLTNGTYYCGYSKGVDNRIKEHNNGKCIATRNYRPVELIWQCSFKNKYIALDFEKYLKSSSGKAFRNKHLI